MAKAKIDLSNKFKNLKLNADKDINILLLGASGVGKSTYINSIANYLFFDKLKDAERAESLQILIPSKIRYINSRMEISEISVGNGDANEYLEAGESATQDVKTYVFSIGASGKTRIRFIDTPGIGDNRGVDQDAVNCDNILAYLANLQDLHAICMLMHPTNVRKNTFFEYCIKELLSRLDKSAAETFRYLMAVRNGVRESKEIRRRSVESWKQGQEQFWKLFSYIIGDNSRSGLKAHQIKNTISINEARRLIVQLSQPLADITQLIDDNVRILTRHEANLNSENANLKQLKAKLYMPTMDLEVTKLAQPVTVCTAKKCAEPYKVGNETKWHYKTRCHNPCYLTGVSKDMIGDPGLLGCTAMGGTNNCIKCQCHYSVHMHVYYFSKIVEIKIIDSNVQANVCDKESAIREMSKLKDRIAERKQNLESEKEQLTLYTAQFASFLQDNALSPYNDAYEAYIKYLIRREENSGSLAQPDVIYSLDELLRRHLELKHAFKTNLERSQQLGINSEVFTAKSVLDNVWKLYKLPIFGEKIKELLKSQKNARSVEHNQSCEFVQTKTAVRAIGVSQTDTEVVNKSKKTNKEKEAATDDERKKKLISNKNKGVHNSNKNLNQIKQGRPANQGNVNRPQNPSHHQSNYQKKVNTGQTSRPHDNYAPRPHDRYPPRSHDPYSPHPYDPYAPRPFDPYPLRSHDPYPPRPHDPYAPRPHDRYPPRSHDPYPPHPYDPYAPRTFDPYPPLPHDPYPPPHVSYPPRPYDPYASPPYKPYYAPRRYVPETKPFKVLFHVEPDAARSNIYLNYNDHLNCNATQLRTQPSSLIDSCFEPNLSPSYNETFKTSQTYKYYKDPNASKPKNYMISSKAEQYKGLMENNAKKDSSFEPNLSPSYNETFKTSQTYKYYKDPNASKANNYMISSKAVQYKGLMENNAKKVKKPNCKEVEQETDSYSSD